MCLITPPKHGLYVRRSGRTNKEEKHYTNITPQNKNTYHSRCGKEPYKKSVDEKRRVGKSTLGRGGVGKNTP